MRTSVEMIKEMNYEEGMNILTSNGYVAEDITVDCDAVSGIVVSDNFIFFDDEEDDLICFNRVYNRDEYLAAESEERPFLAPVATF